MNATVDDVRYAYRLLLGREPDEEGFAGHCRSLTDLPVSVGDLAATFLRSEEYLARLSASTNPIEVSFGDYSMYVPATDSDIGATVARGGYEPHVTAVVRENLHPGATFVDVGANIGYFATMAAHLVGSKGRVIAVEPMDKNVQVIYASIRKNEFSQIEVFPFAASSKSQVVPMATDPRTSNGEVITAAGDRRPSLFAQARRLDDLLPGLDRIDLVKFDIEGHELPAWRGFSRGIAAHKPMVLTEFHPKCMSENAGVDPAEYLAVLFDYAATVQVLIGPAERAVCSSPDEVMSQWVAADRRLNSGGTTHLDLFAKPR